MSDTIAALSTAPGLGAMAVIRVSGKETFSIVQKIFTGKTLSEQPSHTLHFGYITEGNVRIDEVVASVFKAPHSYTKEDVVEISCHGSPYIVDKILHLLIHAGARYAKPGEFTQRAFLNGRFDLAQAEAVADLISADCASTHMAAMHQMRGGFSNEIKKLRDELVQFAALIELELDFAEEDVTFAERTSLKQTVCHMQASIQPLIESFAKGNALKQGVPVAIVGKPNAGKSTLLNALFNEEKAIVSPIAGTTRDVIEDQLILEDIKVRFIDTAGLRYTTDVLENIGIEKTRKKMQQASLILYVFDSQGTTLSDLQAAEKELLAYKIPILWIANKADRKIWTESWTDHNIISLSAQTRYGLDVLKKQILQIIHDKGFKTGNLLVTNLRHSDALIRTQRALEEILHGIAANLPTDLLAEHLREALYHLGLITGEVTNDEVLGAIFSKFCIGK